MGISLSNQARRRRQRIVDEAVKIADAEGIKAVSMRRLAERLDVSTMSIYTYVTDKDELLDLMRDEVSRGMLVPEPMPDQWRAALRAIAMHTRDAIDAHPWVFASAVRKPRRRINSMRHIEQSISVMRMLGVEGEKGRAVLTAVDDYVFGHCFRKRSRERLLETAEAERAAPGRAREPEIEPETDPEVDLAVASGELPLTERYFQTGARSQASNIPLESDFETGLEWLLDGIEAMTHGSSHSAGRP